MTNSTADFPKRPDVHPIIYAYTEPRNTDYEGMYKVGYTARTLEERMVEHYPTARPGTLPYEAFVIGPAIRPDGSTFMDHAVFDRLAEHGHPRLRADDGTLTEWVACSLDDIKTAYNEVYGNTIFATARTENFSMREEQEEAVAMTKNYFENLEEGQKPQFLWNAKMRFGKTFAAYQLAKQMGLKRILVMSFKTAVAAAWEDDLMTHVDFDGWQFVTRDNELVYEDCDQDRPIVCFGSFQDILQLDAKTGTIKQHNEWIHENDWDLVILDEYHFGAWRENAKKLFESITRDEEDIEDLTEEELEQIHESGDENEWELPITSRYYLYLSGTPFRALNSGEFMEDQIFSWTYSDEQRRKEEWDAKHPGEKNPYEALPKVVLMTYRVPEAVIRIARKGEHNRFSLNEFFAAEGEFEQAQFVHKEEVQKWLDFVRAKYTAEDGTNLKLGKESGRFPFSDTTLLDVLVHTLWFLPNVASCYAMANLLSERKNQFYWDYNVIVAAGPRVGNGVAALEPVRDGMMYLSEKTHSKLSKHERESDPTQTKTITLTCGKLTTGVTVRPWSGIFMLRDLNSPETYFQSAFRIQSPWVVDTGFADGILQSEIMKREVYIFDFAINRALSMVATYARKLAHGGNVEKATGELIEFLPVLAYDDGIMTPMDAEQILDMTVSDTTATMLARRWKSAMLVNVDDATLEKVLAHPEAMRIIKNIESFRSNSQSDTVKKIIATSEDVKKAKKEAAAQDKKPPKAITDKERELRKLRQDLQKSLLKLISRIPVFMYLTDNREQCLEDVIRKLEPKLFTKVTGIKVSEFEVLLELGIIDEEHMNDSVFLFRRYEDSSLTYTGIDKHTRDRNIGLFSKTISEEEYEEAEIEIPEDPNDLLGLSKQTGKAKAAQPELDTDKPKAMPVVDVDVVAATAEKQQSQAPKPEGKLQSDGKAKKTTSQPPTTSNTKTGKKQKYTDVQQQRVDYWNRFYAYIRSDDEMMKMWNISKLKDNVNQYISFPVGLGNDCRLNVIHKQTANKIVVEIWCKTDKLYPTLMANKDNIETATSKLPGRLVWDELNKNTDTRKVDVSRSCSDDETRDFKWACSWLKELAMAIYIIFRK